MGTEANSEIKLKTDKVMPKLFFCKIRKMTHQGVLSVNNIKHVNTLQAEKNQEMLCYVTKKSEVSFSVQYV